jgi:hypothetical protein
MITGTISREFVGAACADDITRILSMSDFSSRHVRTKGQAFIDPPRGTRSASFEIGQETRLISASAERQGKDRLRRSR